MKSISIRKILNHSELSRFITSIIQHILVHFQLKISLVYIVTLGKIHNYRIVPSYFSASNCCSSDKFHTERISSLYLQK